MGGFLGSLLSAGTSLIGGMMSSDSATKQAEANYQNQLQFAQNGLQWRALDATNAEKAYGINRLALLGAPTTSFQNTVGDTGQMGAGVAQAGQDIGRALNAMADKNDRQRDLENKLLEAKIANVNSDTVRNQMAASKAVTQAPTAPTPLYQDFVDDKGRHFRLPSGKASSAMQNWASLPAQIPIAITQAGDAIQSEYHILMDPVNQWFRSKFGSSGARGDVVRAHIPESDRFYSPF